jgi:hypothetical protein
MHEIEFSRPQIQPESQWRRFGGRHRDRQVINAGQALNGFPLQVPASAMQTLFDDLLGEMGHRWADSSYMGPAYERLHRSSLFELHYEVQDLVSPGERVFRRNVGFYRIWSDLALALETV